MTEEEKIKNAETELSDYKVKMSELTNYINDTIRYKNIKEGLKAVNCDGMPKGNMKENYSLEEAIELVDEKLKWLSDNSIFILRKCNVIEMKMDKLKYPFNTVLQLKFKECKRNWEIAESLNKDKKTVQRYLESAINYYSNL